MTESVATFCRICEPSCGLRAEVENGELRSLKPDREHPVTGGFACHKGLRFAEVHADPDRLNQPMRRVGDRFEPCDWDTALGELGDRLGDIVKTHGPRSVAAYIGNPAAFSTLATPAMLQLMKAIGSDRLFNSGTQDCSNKFAGAEGVFGTATLHPVPDLERTDYALIFGENPAVSHMSFISIPHPMAVLKAARQRGATIRFVNPRRIESATPGTGDVLQIRPDTDAYLMAALLHEIDAAGLFDEAVVEAHGKHVDGLRAFIADYPADVVAPVVGLPADEIRETALAFARAPSACVHMSTGVNMGRQGTLCYWLLQMLSFVTGNLDRPGGNRYAPGFYPATKAGRVRQPDPFFESEFGPLRHIFGALPGNLLADMIEAREQPIRALIVMAGNPLLSVAGEERLRAAFDQLDLLIVIDLFRNATGEHAHFLLPSADMLEREDINMCGLGMQHRPFVQYTPAVVPPRHQRREEWWILGKIAEAMGIAPLPPDAERRKFDRLEHMLATSDLTLERLRSAPHGVAELPPPEPGHFYDTWIQTDDQRVDCCPPIFAEPIDRARDIFDELRSEAPDQLKLISLRTPYMHNSWFQNAPSLKRKAQLENPVHVSPDDADRLGLAEGQPASLSNHWGRLDCVVRLDETLRPGVVAMTHGWGNQKTPGMRVAQRHPGVNVNRLLPSGPGSYERISNQAHMTGIPVQLSARQGIERPG